MIILVYSGLLMLIFIKYSNTGIYENRKIFSFLCFGYLILICVLKANSYGDIPGYILHYEEYSLSSYGGLWNLYRRGYLKDFSFYAVAKFLNNSGVSADVWIGIIAFVFTSVCAHKMYEESLNPLLSILVLLVFYLRFSMTALRQALALSFTLLSSKYIREKRVSSFLFFSIIAALFHSSAIVFIPAYWISKLKIGKKQIVIILLGLVVSVFIPSVARNAIARFTWEERLSGYSTSTNTLSWAGYIIQFSIFIFCYIFRNNVRKDCSMALNDTYLNLMMVGLFFQGFTTTIAEVFRLSYYYSIVNFIVLPNTIEQINVASNKKFLRIVVFSILILYMAVSKMFTNMVLIWQV